MKVSVTLSRAVFLNRLHFVTGQKELIQPELC